jgi:hypothetical protein
MPNCDFYATAADHEPLLEWLFAENTSAIYELSSIGENPLRRFTNAAEIMRESAFTLQLHVNNSGPVPEPRRIDIDPKYHASCGFRYRYALDGWGLVQLYLRVPTTRNNKRHLDNSHTNHSTQTRAERWAPVSGDIMGSPDAWDFKKITSFSSRLNREIRKRAVANINSRAVLPSALAEWENGVNLDTYNITTAASKLVKIFKSKTKPNIP